MWLQIKKSEIVLGGQSMVPEIIDVTSPISEYVAFFGHFSLDFSLNVVGQESKLQKMGRLRCGSKFSEQFVDDRGAVPCTIFLLVPRMAF